jgi:hypothetical protein
MKKTFLLSALLLLSIVYTTILGCSNSSNSSSSEKTRSLMITNTLFGKDSFPLPSENTINLAYDYILPARASAYESDAQEDIMIGGAAIPQVAMLTLKKSDLENLYNRAYTLLQSSSGSNFITAVEIFYGVNSNAMVYYFLPVCLQTPSVSPPNMYTYTLTPNCTGLTNFYVYNASTGSLSSASFAQFQSDTASYASQIRITHYYGAAVTFIETIPTSTNVQADSKYVIFPFQEIFHVLACNNVDSLSVCNAGVPMRVPGKDYYTKHDLILGPWGPGTSNPMEEDLAHMVPPDYGALIYPITH